MHGHFDIKRAPRLDSEGRIRELRPQQLLAEVAGVAEGMTCVDLGCGTGTFSLPMGHLVGLTGTVYAVDDSPDMLGYLKGRNPPPNLKLVEGDAANTGLPGGIAEVSLLAFILHEVKERSGLIAEAFRLLKPGGRAVVVEWKAELDSPGPPRSLRLSRTDVDVLFRGAGFSAPTFQDWSTNHYVAISTKGKAG